MNGNSLEQLKTAVIKYDEILAKNIIEQLIEGGADPLEILSALTEAIAEIGDRFEKNELFLPDLMMGAKTMKTAIIPLEKEIKEKGLKRTIAGKVVIGTVFGDLHNIGKGIVATLLEANGFEVIDLGVNVDSKKFIDAIKTHSPDILAMSSLLTTTAPEQERVINSLVKSGVRVKVKVMVGGGPITRDFAEKIGADGYEPTAPLAVKLAKELCNR